jgi:hypothetical protein
MSGIRRLAWVVVSYSSIINVINAFNNAFLLIGGHCSHVAFVQI